MRRYTVWVAALVLFACAGDVERSGTEPPAPGGGSGKVVVETATGPVIADELVIGVAAGVDRADLEHSLAPHGVEIVWRGPRTGLYLVRLADAAAREDTARALRRVPSVAFVEPHRVASGTGIGTTPSIKDQWYLPAAGIRPVLGGDGGTGVTVAILDTGVAYEDHSDALASYALAPDLAGVDFVGGYDFINDDEHANDDHGHGTHVANLIAGDGVLVAVAPGSTLMPVKVLDADNLGTELALAEGILYAADHGADVINMSLAFSSTAFPSRYLQDAVRSAADGGSILVGAVGNQGQDAVPYPAAFRDVLAVGASSLGPDFKRGPSFWPWVRARRSLEMASYSNRGYLVDLTAPGGQIDVDRDGDGQPEAIVAQSFEEDPTEFSYVSYAGSSQAAALISGVVSRAVARDGDANVDDLRAALGKTATRLDREIISVAGRGFVNAERGIRRMRWRRPTPGYLAAVDVGLAEDPDVGARVTAEILDMDGHPARRVEVYGSFTGSAVGAVSGRTDRNGLVTFESGPLLGDVAVVGFQVEAIVTRRWGRHVDRPRPFVRIDSCSLGLLASYASQQADGVTGGQGIGTTPSAPLSLVDDSLAVGERETALLLNYSWSSATVPMAAAAEPAWLVANFDGGDAALVVSDGSGVAGDAITIDASSLAAPVDTPDGACIDLLVSAGVGGAGVGTTPSATPILPDPRGSCSDANTCETYRALFAALLADDPPSEWSPDLGGSEAEFAHVTALIETYRDFVARPWSSPVSQYGEILEVAGIGLTQVDDAGTGAGVGSTPW